MILEQQRPFSVEKNIDSDFSSEKDLPAMNSAQWNMFLSTKGTITRFGCLFFKFVTTTDTTTALWKINKSLVPSSWIIMAADDIFSYLKSISTDSYVISLHIRAEQDWQDHCSKWGSIRDGIIRDNCYTNTELLDITLLGAGIPIGSVIYIAGAYDRNDLNIPLFKRLSAKFKLILKQDVSYRLPDSIRYDMATNRELFAAIDYEICYRANLFIGNSVSTFSAMLLLTRERDRVLADSSKHSDDSKLLLSKRHFYYNGGGETFPSSYLDILVIVPRHSHHRT